MVSDLVPFLENLFSYYCENKQIKKVKRNDISQTRNFANFFRFFDDFTVLNDCPKLEQSFKETYSPKIGGLFQFLDYFFKRRQENNKNLIEKCISKVEQLKYSLVSLLKFLGGIFKYFKNSSLLPLISEKLTKKTKIGRLGQLFCINPFDNNLDFRVTP